MPPSLITAHEQALLDVVHPLPYRRKNGLLHVLSGAARDESRWPRNEPHNKTDIRAVGLVLTRAYVRAISFDELSPAAIAARDRAWPYDETFTLALRDRVNFYVALGLPELARYGGHQDRESREALGLPPRSPDSPPVTPP